MLTGWASGTFGLFGLQAEHVKNPTLNYIGVALAVVGLGLYLQVEPEEVKFDNEHSKKSYGTINEVDYSPLNAGGDFSETKPNNDVALATSTPSKSGHALRTSVIQEQDAITDVGRHDPFQGLSSAKRRILGISMALVAGFFFGCSFDPSQYIIDHEDDSVRESTLIFVFPQYCGILVGSFLFTCVYCLIKLWYMKQQPFVHSGILVPAMCSGLVWGIACTSWFIANQNLGFSISFPIITSGPGFVGALWGTFRYGEIKGKKNFLLLGGAFAITLPALIMVGLSH